MSEKNQYKAGGFSMRSVSDCNSDSSDVISNTKQQMMENFQSHPCTWPWLTKICEREKKVIFSYTALCQSLPVSNFLTCNLLTASDHSLQTGCFSNDAASTMLACSLQQINFVSTIQDENTTGLIGYIIYFAYWLYHLFILLIYFC